MDCFFKFCQETDALSDSFKNIKLYDQKDKELLASEVLKNVKYLVLVFIGYEKLQEKYNTLTTQLADIFKRANTLNLHLQVIYVPIDVDESFMTEHINEHTNWYHLNFNDIHKRLLIEVYQVIINPTIVVLSKDGELISRDGVEDILHDGINVLVTWT